MVAAGWLIAIAAAEVALGLWLALSTPPIAERMGFALYGAGAPISAAFAALAGELPLAPFTDIIVWLVTAAGVATLQERRRLTLPAALAVVVAIALTYGAIVSTFIERV